MQTSSLASPPPAVAELPPARESARVGWRASPPLVLAAGAALLAWRCGDLLQHPQLWAEEGYFYFDARAHPLAAILQPLAGYLHFVPRALGAAAQLLDPGAAPALFVAAALALTFWVMSRALSSRCPLPCRAGCALAVGLAPDASEVLLHVVNLQWVLALGFLLLLCSDDPATRRQRVHDFGAALLCGLTGPFCVLFAPLFWWRVMRRRSRASTGLAAIVTICALIQGGTILLHPQPHDAGAQLDWHALAAFPGVRVVGGLLGGGLLPPDFSWRAGAALTALLLLGFTAQICGGIPGNRNRAMLAWASIALLASAAWRCRDSLPTMCTRGAGMRYVYPVEVIAIWLLLIAATTAMSARVRCAAAALLVWMIAVNGGSLRIDPLPDRRWQDYVPKLRAGEAVEVTINPGWTFSVPARRS